MSVSYVLGSSGAFTLLSGHLNAATVSRCMKAAMLCLEASMLFGCLEGAMLQGWLEAAMLNERLEVA